MQQQFNLSGKRFERLVVTEEHTRIKRVTRWRCICDCGNITYVSSNRLRTGYTKSCGCLSSEKTKERSTTHGMRQSREYAIWCAMKNRCNNPHNKRFHCYGGRGIMVCKEWNNSFEQFYKDMGDRPNGRMSIGRKNNDLGYSASNCRWETVDQQSHNTRWNRLLTVDGETQPLCEWLKIYTSINQQTVSSRIKHGWAHKDALSLPANHAIHYRDRKDRHVSPVSS